MSEFPDRPSDSDALIWRIEGDPVLRSPILVVGLLDRPPSWPDLRASLQRAVEDIPRLRQRLVPGPLGRGLRWVEDPGFSADAHVRHVRATDEGGLRTVLDLAEPDVMAAFDPARPLWQLTVVEGLEDGAAAIVLRFHHTITDGVGGIALASRFFDRGRARREPPTAPEGPPAPGPVSRLGGLLQAGVAAGLHPVRTGVGAVRTARSVARILTPATSPLSTDLVGRGIDRRLHVLELPLADLRHAASAAGGTVNDVFLAAVGGGLREYHERRGAPLAAVRVTMPISLRDEGDRPGGNRFTPARFVLPIDDPDPARRAQLAGAIVRRWRHEPAVGLTPLLASALAALPAPVVQRLFAGMLRSMDVDAVDVPGLRRPARLGGAQIERLWAFAPPTGAALSVTLLSHLDTACVGIAADTAAVVDPELLASCMARAFDEVVALAAPPLVRQPA